jgi:serine/threonine protein kinase
MLNIERLMVETGQVINSRYQLQRLVKHGQTCVVYQGFDQVLQRAVAVKAAPAEYLPFYRASMRLTSQFSHPNIVDIYDLIIDPDMLYIVQEYVEGNDFAALLNTSLSAHTVADLGLQICHALLYASTSSRKVCHGDLTPSAILRDGRGLIRVNGFALPTNLEYFSEWSIVGGDGIVVSDQELPPGQMSEDRLEDDTRAVGLLLYQLLTGHPQGITSVDPPSDGRLRFQRNVPPELCELVARTVVRQHPQHITSPQMLFGELRKLAEALEPPAEMAPGLSGPYQTREMHNAGQYQVPSSRTGNLVTSLPTREAEQAALSPSPYQGFGSTRSGGLASTVSSTPSQTLAEVPDSLVSARQAAYPLQQGAKSPPRRVNLPVLLGIGVALFVLFFVIGYFLAHAVFAF